MHKLEYRIFRKVRFLIILQCSSQKKRLLYLETLKMLCSHIRWRYKILHLIFYRFSVSVLQSSHLQWL